MVIKLKNYGMPLDSKFFLKKFHHHHHHHSSSEDGSGGFFFLDTTKCLFHTDFFTAFLHISVASSTFSPGRRWDKNSCLYVLVGAPGWRDGLT